MILIRHYGFLWLPSRLVIAGELYSISWLWWTLEVGSDPDGEDL